MVGDANFWENIVTSVISGVILFLLGGIIAYFSRNKLKNILIEAIENTIINIKNNPDQSNEGGGSNLSIGSVDTLNLQIPPRPNIPTSDDSTSKS